ncbi:TATA-binding protein-associated factor 172 [Schistocerca nitens]|uniref:TATA-binding protein-associated factor 172 n=1 Tax=Schistocerca nitens TaxID=7011 RepID=UPI002118284A|nr:TATA-binding protein-associated factor 172 [Schistocerca nitens]
MTSRLDRLFVLLETGSSPVTRRAAARQLGEVQRLHPHELHHLLARIASYLHSSAWETRIAAAQAVEAVISNVPQWDPPAFSKRTVDRDGAAVLARTGRMTFEKFDMCKVLTNGGHLMASEGKEFDQDEDLSASAMRERMAKQRQLLNARLGLDVSSRLGIDMEDLISAEDFSASVTDGSLSFLGSCGKSVGEVVQQELSQVEGMSSREMNRARRLARQQMTKQRSRDTSTQNQEETSTVSISVEEPERKKIKIEDTGQDDILSVTSHNHVESTPDGAGGWGVDAVDWPFEGFCDRLCHDLFSPSWEARHGAATTLREVIRIHGRSAGKATYMSHSEQEEYHEMWLEDMALRLLCVLALDRFGDFVSDQVVAPVRETCAQTLGSVLHLMTNDGVRGVLTILLQLLKQNDWEARHGGLLGLKYLLAVRMDMVKELLAVAFPLVLGGLSDPVDDVGAVAASALIPVANNIVEQLPHQVETIVNRLWDLLLEQDELAAACNSFMGLLAALLSLPETHKHLRPQPLQNVVPRLWPFLSHSTSSVRRATLQTLRTLTSVSLHCDNGLQWTSGLLQDALRHIFQRVLVEPVAEIQDLAEQVWGNLIRNSQLTVLLNAACPYFSTWLCLTMQPAKIPFDPSVLIHSKTSIRDSGSDKVNKRLRVSSLENVAGTAIVPKSEQKLFVGGTETTPLATREGNVMKARCMASRMLGLLSCFVIKHDPVVVYTPDMETPIDCYVRLLLANLNSKSALQRMVVGLVVAEWARLDPGSRPCPEALRVKLLQCISEVVYFDEIALSFTRLLQETRDFIAMLKHYKLPIDVDAYGKVLILEQIQQLSGPVSQQLLSSHKLKPKVAESLEERRRAIQAAVSQTSSDQTLLSTSTQAALAGAVTMLQCLPEKLSPVVKPLMEAIKKEENEQLQSLAAEHLSRLVELCVNRIPCPNAKIITNLCTFLRSDTEFSPRIQATEGTSNDSGTESLGEGSRTGTPTSFANNYVGILTLLNQQRSAERAAFRRSNSVGNRGPGRPPVTDIPLEELFATEDATQKQNKIQRRGASYALTSIASYFGKDLPSKLPKLWEYIVGKLMEVINPNHFDTAAVLNSDAAAEDLVSTLLVLEITCPALDRDLLAQVLECLPRLCLLLTHPYCAVRHMAARCLGALASLASVPVMTHVVSAVLPLLDAMTADTRRQGAVECLACIVDRLQENIVPYIVLLVVPLLGRMSDPNQPVRLMATHCFATLIQLMPLDGGIPDPPSLTPKLAEQKERERIFLEQLFNPKSIQDYKIPVPIKADLRSYQQSGVNWLAFLNKYKLHGILCDDMGLGKTLQSICILAGDHYFRSQRYKLTMSPDCAPLPSLVICPPTLTGHWVYEVEKFLTKDFLNPLQYTGPPAERERLRSKVKTHNLIVASYDIVRKDIDFFSSIKWNYCILDEGHIIKNGKTKASKAVKQLVANHRLILSGTPIQNNVLELWSLFDFLMPGFLGTEKQFTARYSKPILASRDPKSSPKEQEAGALAMEALHRQVLPFLLRRMKEDVLQDLPPKITQDYYCDLSPLQQELYEDFARSKALQSLQDTLSQGQSAASVQGNTHIFQALRYLQNVCNHPKLVLTSQHPQFEKISSRLKQNNTNMADIQHACKLPALKQLLLDCGIGLAPGGPATDLVVNQHRALIFCQLKAMLDILENDLFTANMPNVSYLRLDGSIPPGMRHSVVTRFNNDPSIDVLLLTTQVGGLGLNLTGADTVIFVEHDWNPMKDLQAMDRAHRIGQKKVVNVYRLITRGTLEEKIMGLQKFKLLTANTVISSENASMETMGTEQLLDLFSLDDKRKDIAHSSSSHSQLSGVSMKTVLETLPDLWEDKQYEEEYDLSTFMQSLKKE